VHRLNQKCVQAGGAQGAHRASILTQGGGSPSLSYTKTHGSGSGRDTFFFRNRNDIEGISQFRNGALSARRSGGCGVYAGRFAGEVTSLGPYNAIHTPRPEQLTRDFGTTGGEYGRWSKSGLSGRPSFGECGGGSPQSPRVSGQVVKDKTTVKLPLPPIYRTNNMDYGRRMPLTARPAVPARGEFHNGRRR